jgi:hypothetical protein
MAKILNIRERVHQPYRDALIRTAGLTPGTLGSNNDLFIAQGRDEGFTNLKTSAILPNDSSMIILAARVMQWFRKGNVRVEAGGEVTKNGDFDEAGMLAQLLLHGNGLPTHHDVYRLHWQCAEGLFWTLGAGDKDSLKSMPSMYFPYGGGLDSIMASARRVTVDKKKEVVIDPMIHLQNGEESHTSILRLARAITITPRQLIKANVAAVAYDDGGNGAIFGVRTPNGRNMLDPIHNLNAADGIAKVVSLTIDGLVSRDVQ